MILRGKRAPLPAQPVVHRRFEAHAEANPEAIAVCWAGERLTYRELNARANQFAHLLLERGLARDGQGQATKIGVCLDYSFDMLVAILGTLKAGAAYVPLDPAYPQERLRLLLGQIPGLAAIVASPATVDLVDVATAPILDLAQSAGELAALPATAADVTVTGEDVCYAVFTSGSTGTPKLTAVRHENWFNLLNWLQLEYGLGTASNNLVVSAFGFDLSQRSLMAPLFCGATQYLLASRNFDPAMAYRILRDQDIRVVHCASSTLYVLVDWEVAVKGDALTRLDYVLFGGEPLHVERLLGWAGQPGNNCTLLHQYGVAECADVATSYDLAGYRRGEHDIAPVGRPGYNTDIHIVDEELTGVSAGESGEICIAGRSVGSGYLNGSGPESARFTAIEVDGEQVRLYRTGDRGYVTDAGELIIQGRIDNQVKVRGMRIDPHDIERALGRLPGIQQAAVVVVRTDAGDCELNAFLVPTGAGLDVDEVRAQLLKSLPRNMVPAGFRTIAELPLSPHGKVDRAALLDRLRTVASI
ncbi:amino acid adenylation domain-containing protein [Paractinoplanes lichenicola]|uniref:Amino acid adenylation domain-containing protein n=1 Tax=Paractinoplanes lichenicola TaxID=2802976 RepID=A0ABS1VMT6_9ACTN|nr:amino acid adenylation domain-containing protein [Actinoplanes lichenicola]MBL7256046.1 amino acid adenylation domain-containing protein [Actinoplanes lichenicola]